MSHLHNSPTHDASSSSTIPPSDATLTDDLMDRLDSEAFTRVGNYRSQFQPPEATFPQSLALPEKEEENLQPTNYDLSTADDVESSSYNNEMYEDAECALLAYSRTNQIDKLKDLLEKMSRNELNLNLNYRGQQKQNYSWSALHLACYFGNEEVVALLLSKKQFRDRIDVNIKNSSGDTPLHKATLTNRGRIVQKLLSNGANVFVKNCDGLFAKQLTSDKQILEMLEATEQADKNLLKQNMFKAVDNGDLRKLQEYFQDYDSLRDVPEFNLISEESSSAEKNLNQARQDDLVRQPSNENGITSFSRATFINQMTDDRGNNLLHLAAMRGFNAICVYLLEQGFDPYRKNKLGQTCIELSSFKLRQLFMSVKPAAGQLRKLSKERVTRFEGPLLRKVRILGWKQMYVVLENGVILLFNNRRDSMNQARRGYKYLESAICEPDPNDLGMFSVRFSDNSRATFLVSPSHLNYYTTFKLPLNDSNSRQSTSGNQIELVRQKWVDSIRDHIVYSTEFIRKGLKFDDEDDIESMNYDGSSLATLNHLLPLDTIKSFVQEARAHYSILERHADSLCNLAQSISVANQRVLTSSFEASTSQQHWNSRTTQHPQQASNEPDIRLSATTNATTSASTSTGSRLLGFIRPNRQQRPADDTIPANRSQNALVNSSLMRARNSFVADEFLQDNWPCLLFHLRLLMESTENTKNSMGQALALMEHQEQLRQNRIQHQEERCRVLEDSLQALARDHHELEKSLSISQIYQSACRSVSMSTDLNEYHDAFDEFDDEKTMTPNSLPSDEELDKRIQDVINEEEQRLEGEVGTSYIPDYEDDDEDLESNCSALTVETVTDQYLSVADVSNSSDVTVQNNNQESKETSRTKLPCPMIPRDQVSIWSILKNCIGKELSKITMPVVFNEPLTMLQRSCEGLQYCNYLVEADSSDDPIKRMELVCAFIIASLSGNALRIVKPFNPLLYETYEIEHELEDGTKVKGFAQQVSHHPPITAAYGESDYFSYNGVINPKIKFWGRSVEVFHDGACRVHLRRHNESYSFKAVACSIHNIIVGKLWFEHHGPLDVRCTETNLQANLVFKQAGWFSNDLHRFDGFISSGIECNNPKRIRFVYGKWSNYIKSVDYSDYENYMKDNQQKLFRIPDYPDQCKNTNDLANNIRNMSLSGLPNSTNNNNKPNNEKSLNRSPASAKASNTSGSGDVKSSHSKSESTQSLDIPNSITLWKLETQFFSEYYNFSLFTLKLNELTPALEQNLPKTDSRFRPDVRKLEEGDLDGAAREKERLEEKQRASRSRDKRFKDPSPDMLWFELKSVPNMKDKLYVYKGGYWENKRNPEKFPHLF